VLAAHLLLRSGRTSQISRQRYTKKTRYTKISAFFQVNRVKRGVEWAAEGGDGGLIWGGGVVSFFAAC
jgi:hypothetical protein